jgi:hypothetical protein
MRSILGQEEVVGTSNPALGDEQSAPSRYGTISIHPDVEVLY